ncbi:hypothetical protein CP8484711_1695B, partial [Chlamydia psittaci 84-8471/1]
ISRHTIIYLS